MLSSFVLSQKSSHHYSASELGVRHFVKAIKELTGRDVVAAACVDIERCFLKSSKLQIRTEFNQNMNGHIAFVGSGGRARIKTSTDLCNFQVTNLPDYFFVLIQVGHELAHFLNKHNDHSDEEDRDYKSLETWADFFGARIFMLLISFNTRTRKQISQLVDELEQNQVLSDIGAALKQVSDYVYAGSPTDRYPHPKERVQIFGAGVSSFFMRAFGDFKGPWTLHVLLMLMRESGLFDEIAGHDPDFDAHKEFVDRSMQIQQRLQGMQVEITPGLKPMWEPLIGTSYDLSYDQVENNRKKLVEIVEKSGFDLSSVGSGNFYQ